MRACGASLLLVIHHAFPLSCYRQSVRAVMAASGGRPSALLLASSPAWPASLVRILHLLMRVAHSPHL